MRETLETAALVLGTLGAASLATLDACTTRGVVYDYAHRPIAGADVVMFDDTRTIMATTTDDEGAYWFFHARGARKGRLMAICAAGMRPNVDTAHSALFYTGFGLTNVRGLQDTLYWPAKPEARRMLPPTCQLPR